MVKRMRKAKTSGGGGERVAVDLSRRKASSLLGVRTRAKTMDAIKKSSSFSTSVIIGGDNGCNYLQLRSRRVERRVAPLAKRAEKNKCSTKVGRKSKKMDEKEEACFGDNELEFENNKRISRESTPSNLIVGSEDIPKTPTSSNKRTIYNVRIIKKTHNGFPKTPSGEAMEELFAREEKMQIEKFIKEYNFDPVNEKPLKGRYEWVELKP